MRYLVVLFVLFSGSRALAFEGVLHMKMTVGENPPIPSDVYLRENGDSRTDTVMPTTQQPMSVLQLVKGEKVTVTTLFHRDRRYAESDQPPPKPQTNAFAGAAIEELPTEEIAGQKCRHVHMVISGSPIDVWTTDALGIDVEKTRGVNQGMAGNMMSALAAKGIKGLPLKIRAVIQGQTMTVETTAIEAKKLDASLFTLPKGYAKSG
jgi:hypothetical protein